MSGMMAECGSCGRYLEGSMLVDHNDNPVGFMCDGCWSEFFEAPMDPAS